MTLIDNKQFSLQAILKGLEEVDIFDTESENAYFLDDENQLTHLAINYCSDIDIDTICNISTLTELNLQSNNLSELPESIGQLHNLTVINLEDNNLVSLPKSIVKLQSLTALDLESNNLRCLPETIGKLRNLNYLGLSENNLTCLPETIGKLQNLDYLGLSENSLTRLPESIIQLKDTDTLDLFNNPITKHLKGIEDNLSTQELVTYLLEVQGEKTKPLNEAKVLVVGDERVGKTSLINRVLGHRHNPNQKTTLGIDIQKRALANDIQVNIWDFAGQEIAQQTHQFFLSTRSLYVYVLDSQKEDNDSGIFHWLSVIKANSDSSPIIVVVNKRDLNTSYIFDLNRYKDEFNIVDVLYLSAENDEAINAEIKSKIHHTINDLTQCIGQHVRALEDIKFPLPPSWARVKDVLEAMSTGEEDYIESDEYEVLCVDNGIINERLQDTLLTILNQIGTVVTYKDNRRLSAMQIINPHWVTNGVYKIIRSELVDSSALLVYSQLQAIFRYDTNYKLRQYNWLQDLLNQFELSFSIDDTTILLPSRLSPIQPDFALADFQTGLNFRFHYHDLLKKSVISQFIVKMKSYITKAALKYWQRGVFLQHRDCNAVVIADEVKKTITIAVDTDSRAGKELLIIIRHTIRIVNAQTLTCDEEVLLMLENQLVGYVDYDYLIECEKEGHKDIPLPILNAKKKIHTFNIEALLDGYRIKDDTHFNYRQLTQDLIEISLLETENRHAINTDSENQTNDRFKMALMNRKYIVSDQARGGESETGKGSGERDFVIRNSQTGIAESIIEGFILKSLSTTVIDRHYKKLAAKYDTTGNQRNFILVYVKAKDFAGLWQKYQTHFADFKDCSEADSGKDNVKTGRTRNGNRDIFHLFVNFGRS